MIDTHSHIYLPDFQPDLYEVLERASETGITDILMPAIDDGSIAQMDAVNHPGIRFHKMAGLHPCEVDGTRCNLEVTLLARGASKEIIGIGETGLDYYWSTSHAESQKISLRQHCKVARDLGKPVVLHNRNSTDDLLEIISEQQDGRLAGVWHCFTGTIEQGLRAVDLGLYLGIGGVVTFRNSGLDAVVSKLPLERIILETDSPYLAPTPKRGKRNEPSFIRFTARKVAELHRISVEELDRITSENARKLFKMD